MMGFTIILTPFWSAFTEAWAKKEIVWIKKIMQKLLYLWLFLLLPAILMFIFSPWVYKIWVGEKIIIPYSISALVAVWVLLNAWNGIFAYFLNGIGKIKLQLYLGISAAILNVPLALFLGLKFGIRGVLLTNVILALAVSWIFPLQYKKIINHTAYGIWTK